MSGGSLDYVFGKVEDAARRIREEGKKLRKPHWVAFADHLDKVAAALHDCEWVLSADMDLKGADQAIEAVLGKNARGMAMRAVTEELKEWVEKAQEILAESGDVAKA